MKRDSLAYRAKASVLLLVYLALLATAALHVHRPIGEICHECLAHADHPAHVDSVKLVPHDCLVCQLLGTAYIAPTLCAVAVDVSMLVRRVEPCAAAPCRRAVVVPRLRAPPCC